jgi:hypothetical protein
MHKQVCVKVNAYVDEVIAPVVEALSGIDGLVTFESCQKLKNKGRAFIAFGYRDNDKDWVNIGKLCEKISKAIYGIDFADVSLNWSGTRYYNIPLGFLEFKTADAKQIASAVNKLIKD